MQFVQFPNGKIWRIQDNGFIEGTVTVPTSEYSSSEDSLSYELFMDAISENAVGSSTGLEDLSYQQLGEDLVAFSGRPTEELDSDGMIVLPLHALRIGLKSQYDLHDFEVDHALESLSNSYGEESVITTVGKGREIRCPAFPASCDYVRIVVDGLEIAYWVSDEWREDPMQVMGAILGAAKGL